MPWRETRDPYHIVVSEVMLQQTQVDRVVKKYPEFIAAFPSFKVLAQAPLIKILRVWAGMGYNRRALYMRQIARRIAREGGGILPSSPEVLETLPGVGPATARSIAAFAFNAPVAFIETNIRSVFIHEFFPDRRTVKDIEIMPLVRETVDMRNSREWYYALMDYGAMLKTQARDLNRRSAHHAKQSKFAGSNRQLRGKILKILVHKSQTLGYLLKTTDAPREKLRTAINDLTREKLVKKRGAVFTIG